MADIFEISGRIHSTSQEEVVTTSSEIIDEEQNNKKQSEINADVDTALADRYTKEETYNKTELDNLITTPNVQYVTVATYSDLPATGEADTIYRVASWDGSAVDAGMYSEYAWNGSEYQLLAVRNGSLDGVFDISVYNASGGTPAQYADLEAALGTNGANVPVGVRAGGMSVRFINSTGKYEQCRYLGTDVITAETFVNVANWQCIDSTPTTGSQNLVTSGGVANEYGEYIVEQEYVKVVTDSEDKILYAIKANGDVVFGIGIPSEIQEAINDKVDKVIGKGLSTEDFTTLEKNKLSELPTGAEITAMLAGKVDTVNGYSLIDEEYAESVSTDIVPEYLQITADSDGKVLEDINVDGEKEINIPLKVEGAKVSHIDGSDYVMLYLDHNDKILFGVKTDGQIEFGIGVPKQIKDYVDSKYGELSNSINSLQEEIDNFETDKSIKVNLDISNKTVKITSSLSDNYNIENSMLWRVDTNYLLNPCLNYNGTYLIDKVSGTRTLINSETDAIGASGTSYGWIGANHGLPYRGVYTVENHGKDYSDIGSKWTYDSKIVVLVQVEENSLSFIPMYTENDGVYTFADPPAAGTTLTHVSGAVHTGSIVLGTKNSGSNSIQWKPSLDIIDLRFILDGKELTESGEYEGNVLDCIEIYEVYAPEDYLDKLISLAGTLSANPLPKDYKDELGRIIRYTNDYRFTKGGCSVLINDWMTLKKMGFSQFFPVHTKLMETNAFGGSSLQYYLPKSLPLTVSGTSYDFRTPAALPLKEFNWTSQYWENPDLPPDRAIEFVADNNNRRIAGLHYGYIFDQGEACGTNRKNYLTKWWIYSTGAGYGGAFNAGATDVPSTMVPYVHYSTVSFRKYEDYTDNPTGVISLSQFEVNGEYYVFADFSGEGVFTIEIPTEWCGKKYALFEKSSNVELLCGLSQSKMLVKVSNANPMYGYLVFGIHKNNI